jgi:hypothetical protein
MRSIRLYQDLKIWTASVDNQDDAAHLGVRNNHGQDLWTAWMSLVSVYHLEA